MNNNIHDKIRKIRGLKGYSQEYVAQKIGMSQTNYGKIELGQVKPPLDFLDKISPVFEMSNEDILTFDEKFVFHNNSFDTSQPNIYNANFGLHEKALYEQLLKEKDAQIHLLTQILEEEKKRRQK
ncbi:MAG: helix-turn-helix transcriptional regulator [Bacteroidia bacterium]|nr:helix-turn-helix domain-containing protein [Bacteroidia bacterium]MCC6684337.1 helix-turn-helix transcriptional regulator [Bacteroidia bacterium]